MVQYTNESEPAAKHRVTIERPSDRELVVTRTFDGPVRIVFEAWTQRALFERWWVPKSIGLTLVSCEMDVRTGGTYRVVLRHGTSEPMAFFGTYVEVTPPSRLVWTNEEDGDTTVTTVTFEEIRSGTTRVVVHELHPSTAARDTSSFAGVEDGALEAFDQLDELLVAVQRG